MLGAFVIVISGRWVIEPDRGDFLHGLMCFPAGWYCLKFARNLREIRIGDSAIRFLPLDVSLNVAGVLMQHRTKCFINVAGTEADKVLDAIAVRVGCKET